MKTILSTFFIIFSMQLNAQIAISFDKESPRINFGSERLMLELDRIGEDIRFLEDVPNGFSESRLIIVAEKDSDWFRTHIFKSDLPKITNSKEAFRISSEGNKIYVIGNDESGALYGALELADRIKSEEKLPKNLDFGDQPEMVLRGTAIGMQKMNILPDRHVYEYPYTPKNFPWFYDKELWIKYLDMLVENRYNSLYLWNGHPFASLVKLEDYPYALEVDEETFRKNEEIFEFLTTEADKRGIWVIQMFYNIIVSKPFAEHHNIPTQDRGREITPLLEDYTRKSIAAFIEKYPNVGLLVALGEAMSGIENDISWFTNTIIPGVKDGMQRLGREDEPPIILRAHDTDAPKVVQAAFPMYKNLYTTHKYTGESLTTYEPRGPWTKIHQDLSNLASVHISNVHILANLEPFRFGSPNFIEKTVKAMHEVHGANALHLYPQTSYWDWPYTADNTAPRLLEMDRDWIWYSAWGRYAWQKERERNEEIEFWSDEFSKKYGTDRAASEQILTAYEETGEIAPKTLRRFGITEGNRQTLLLGMFMSQLVNPYKWRVYPGFYESTGPEGEILIEYAEKEFNNEPHIGETPLQIIQEIEDHGKKAVEAIDKTEPNVSKNKDEFIRLQNDIRAYKAFAYFFSEKVKAAMLVLRYDHSGEKNALLKAIPHLENSLKHYRKLVELTDGNYFYANSMQTSMRRIPTGGDDGKYKLWSEMLPLYEQELENFRKNLNNIDSSVKSDSQDKKVKAWTPAEVKILSGQETYSVAVGSLVYDKMSAQIIKAAPEISKLTGVKFKEKNQIANGTILKFENSKPVKVVVGFFEDAEDTENLIAPTLENNAAGNIMGQADIAIANALKLDGYPKINIHTYHFETGKNELQLEKGRVLILGFIPAVQKINSRDAGLVGEKSVDWLFQDSN
ncbi:alpha-d-galacturonidase [Zunongwangia sp. HGR-M22]|uniref:alpha-d-galacturonidase n=1 Tax=Zunongwangia sp. HGR-M22 TaxID=3015168 RepID=UPI0022DDF50B|nr:hypothetical protein [Zunongwangia sp. HGR-M22]WBL24690.1 hypothetical protein PBT91_12315 [Zunongwangia sp. HGR-M22]